MKLCEHGLPNRECKPCVAKESRERRWRTGFCKPKKNLMERFELHYIPEPMSGCWIWTDTNNGHGYGLITVKGQRKMAHRVAWELYRGPISEGLQANHKCDVRFCVNPNHLYLGTQAENLEDCITRGRMRKHAPPSRCPRGHEYTPENSYRTQNSGLRCRICRSNDGRIRYYRLKEVNHGC